MFKKKTVFILGAGASWHYGYPTGEDLVVQVTQMAGSLWGAYNKPKPIQGMGVEPRIAKMFPEMRPQKFKNAFDDFLSCVRRFQECISAANPLVIDDFLGRNRDLADVGKLLIAMVLLKREREGVIRSGKVDPKSLSDSGNGDWVRHVVQQLTVDCERAEDLLSNQVTFITFNYDLSLELRLYRALKNYQWFAECGASEQFISKSRFLHVYGKLYDFDTRRPGAPIGPNSNELYPLADSIDRAFEAAKGIRTISPDEKVAAPEIVKAIADAEHLYFLGYGFDRRNNELLGLGRWQEGSPRQAIKFTNFGDLNRISRRVEVIYNRQQGSLTGPNYFAEFEDPLGHAPNPGRHRWTCEKSTKSVYDALAQDFEWPE